MANLKRCTGMTLAVEVTVEWKRRSTQERRICTRNCTPIKLISIQKLNHVKHIYSFLKCTGVQLWHSALQNPSWKHGKEPNQLSECNSAEGTWADNHDLGAMLFNSCYKWGLDGFSVTQTRCKAKSTSAMTNISWLSQTELCINYVYYKAIFDLHDLHLSYWRSGTASTCVMHQLCVYYVV